MSKKVKPLQKRNVFILMAPQFDELAVVQCRRQFGQVSAAVILVGLFAGPLYGLSEIGFQPDLTIADLLHLSLPCASRQLLLIPDGSKAAAILFADPRVHQVCRQMLQQDTYVAAFTAAQPYLYQSGLTTTARSERFVPQDGRQTIPFLESLITLLD